MEREYSHYGERADELEALREQIWHQLELAGQRLSVLRGRIADPRVDDNIELLRKQATSLESEITTLRDKYEHKDEDVQRWRELERESDALLARWEPESDLPN